MPARHDPLADPLSPEMRRRLDAVAREFSHAAAVPPATTRRRRGPPMRLELFVECWNTGASTKTLIRRLGLSYSQIREMWCRARDAGLPLERRRSHHTAPPGAREKLDRILAAAIK